MESKTAIYSWILVLKSDNRYLGWSKAPTMPPCADDHEWIDWRTSQDVLDEDGNRVKKGTKYVKAMQGNPLPEDVDEGGYKYTDGELVKE